MHGSEIWWALIVGTLALFTLVVAFVSTVIFSQRKFITVERQMLEALRLREQRFRSLIENSSDAIALLGGDATVLYASPSTSRILGCPPQEFVNRSFHELVHPDHKQSVQDQFSLLSQQAGVSIPLQFQFLCKDGTSLWIEGIATNLLRDSGVNAIVLNYRDITYRVQAEEHLRSSHDQLRMLSARLQFAREEERTNIAREIHDELGQMLTVLKMDLALFERKLFQTRPATSSRKAVEELHSMSNMIDTIIQSVRRIATELRPEILDELGLKEAIEWELETFETRTGIRGELTSNIDEIKLDRERSTALFRIFQETLTNVTRHARATKVTARLEQQEQLLTLAVRDNGRGITGPECSNSKSLGILGMKERAHLIGAEIAITGEPGKGTLVRVQLPLVQTRVEERRP